MSTFAELLDEQEKTPGTPLVDCMKTGYQVLAAACETCTIQAKCEAIRKDRDIADNMKSYWANLNNGSAGGVGSDE